jgi:hypothetical protein
MPLTWDREYDLPDEEDDDTLIDQIIAHDITAMGAVFMDTFGDFDPGDDLEDEDDFFDDDFDGDLDEEDDFDVEPIDAIDPPDYSQYLY